MALYHSARGSVGYTIVGSPTIVDGVASGFSASSYLRITEQLPSPNKLEIIVSINTKTIPTDRNDWFIGCPSFRNRNIVWGITNSKKMRLFLGSDGTSWDIANGVTGIYSFSDDTSYLMRLTFDGQEYIAYISSDNGLSWVQDIKVTSSLQLSSQYIDIGINDGKGDYFWTGSIDLNNTYIMVNGQPWFGICPFEVKKHQVMGPVGYTVVGTPTITDGVISNFSKTSFLRLTSAFPTIKELEAQFCFKLSDISTTVGLFGTSNNIDYQGLGIIFSGTSKKILLYLSSNGTSWNIVNGGTLVTAFQTGIVYYLRLIYDGTKYELSSSTDKQNWTTEITVNDSREIFIPSTPFNIGYNAYSSGSAQFMRGQIDTNQTYIKVNGKLWFWQPQETKKIIVNGVEVYSKP